MDLNPPSKIGAKLLKQEIRQQRRERLELKRKRRGRPKGLHTTVRPKKRKRSSLLMLLNKELEKRRKLLRATAKPHDDNRPPKGFVDATVTRDGFPAAPVHKTRRSPRRGLAKFI